MERARPENEQQVCELVGWALANGKTLAIHGAGSKRAFGMPVAPDCEVTMGAFDGIIEYEPSELVMTAKPGTPLAAIEGELGRRGQQLAFEPPRLGTLYESAAAQETIGGAFLGNLSGPRRYTAGAARDHLLGTRAVNGRGIAWKSGGRVIKNVTGYDLSRLLAGSWGTLSIVTELTFKVVPAADHTLTLCVADLPVAAGLALLRKVAGSPMVASGLAFMPETTLSALPISPPDGATQSLTLIRIEGSGGSVQERALALGTLLPKDSRQFEFGNEDSLALWKAIRDVVPLTAGVAQHVVIKISLPPSSATAVIDLLANYRSCRWFADAAGACIWLSVDVVDGEVFLPAIRKHLTQGGGNAVLWRAPDTFKSKFGVHSWNDAGLLRLNSRIKESFDPADLFNAGRLYPLAPARPRSGQR